MSASHKLDGVRVGVVLFVLLGLAILVAADSGLHEYSPGPTADSDQSVASAAIAQDNSQSNPEALKERELQPAEFEQRRQREFECLDEQIQHERDVAAGKRWPNRVPFDCQEWLANRSQFGGNTPHSGWPSNEFGTNSTTDLWRKQDELRQAEEERHRQHEIRCHEARIQNERNTTAGNNLFGRSIPFDCR